ncbi:MAG: hypothetical protein RSA70_01695, partial [Clostridia bacterium]
QFSDELLTPNTTTKAPEMEGYLDGHEHYSNDVPYGEKPIKRESTEVDQPGMSDAERLYRDGRGRDNQGDADGTENTEREHNGPGRDSQTWQFSDELLTTNTTAKAPDTSGAFSMPENVGNADGDGAGTVGRVENVPYSDARGTDGGRTYVFDPTETGFQSRAFVPSVKNARLLPIPPERGGSPKLLPIAVNGGARTDGGRTHRFAHTGIGIAAGIKTGTAYAKTRGVTRARIDVMLESADACGASQTLAREVFDVMRSVDAPVVFDANMTENERGFYSDGVLHLNPQKADIRTYLHELAHDTERKSGYSEYASYVLGNLRKSQDYDEYRTIIAKKYRAEGKNLADADLDHEMVAAFTESALGDADFIARLRSDAPNVFRQFKQWLDDCITRFRAKKNLTPEEREIYDRMQTAANRAR